MQSYCHQQPTIWEPTVPKGKLNRWACAGQQDPKPWLVPRARVKPSPSGRLGLWPLCFQPLPQTLLLSCGRSQPQASVDVWQEGREYSMWRVREELPG